LIVLDCITELYTEILISRISLNTLVNYLHLVCI